MPSAGRSSRAGLSTVVSPAPIEAQVSTTVSRSGRQRRPAASAAEESTTRAPSSGGSQNGSAHHGWTSYLSRKSSGTQVKTAAEPVASRQ
jgi:hypothetical protein